MINFTIQIISFLRQSRMYVAPTRGKHRKNAKSGLKFGGEQ